MPVSPHRTLYLEGSPTWPRLGKRVVLWPLSESCCAASSHIPTGLVPGLEAAQGPHVQSPGRRPGHPLPLSSPLLALPNVCSQRLSHPTCHTPALTVVPEQSLCVGVPLPHPAPNVTPDMDSGRSGPVSAASLRWRLAAAMVPVLPVPGSLVVRLLFSLAPPSSGPREARPCPRRIPGSLLAASNHVRAAWRGPDPAGPVRAVGRSGPVRREDARPAPPRFWEDPGHHLTLAAPFAPSAPSTLAAPFRSAPRLFLPLRQRRRWQP